ncbi:MAG: hemolysin III family protein [Verrucomicrobiota bacterium]
MSERSHLCESHEEERANFVSHMIAAVLSLVALLLMIRLAVPLSGWHLTGAIVFGASLVLLYATSAIYHWVQSHPLKKFFQLLDHILIFVLIAGSYTPWLLVNLRGSWGWSLLAVVWGLAVSGSIIKAYLLPRYERLGAAIYVAMGWLVCVAIRPMIENVSSEGLLWLLAGGICYTGGVVFFLAKQLKYSHLIWHLFVMAGSFCHVVAVLVGVLHW